MRIILAFCFAVAITCSNVVHAEQIEPKEQQVNDSVSKFKQAMADRKAKQEAAETEE